MDKKFQEALENQTRTLWNNATEYVFSSTEQDFNLNSGIIGIGYNRKVERYAKKPKITEEAFKIIYGFYRDKD